LFTSTVLFNGVVVFWLSATAMFELCGAKHTCNCEASTSIIIITIN